MNWKALPPPIESQGKVSGAPPVLGEDLSGDLDPGTENPGTLRPRLFKGKREEAEMDMTPMVDVVFLLLIFFMITAAFGMQKSIEIPDPESDQSSQQATAPQHKETQEDNIVIHITRENRVFVEGEEAVTQQELYAKLRHQRDQNSTRTTRHLLVLAESEATHETVVRVLDAAAGVGMDSVRLKTE